MEYEYLKLPIFNDDRIVYIIDAKTNDIVYMSKACMDYCGIKTKDEYIDQKCYKILHRFDEICSFCDDEIIDDDSFSTEKMTKIVSKNIKVERLFFDIKDKTYCLKYIKDDTEYIEKIKQLRITKALSESVQILAKEKDFDVAFNGFLEKLGQFYEADRAYIFEFDLKNNLMSNTYEWCAPGVTHAKENLQNRQISAISRWLDLFKSNGSFHLSSLDGEVDENSDEYKILEPQGIKSLMAAPLILDDVIIGFIGVDEPQKYRQDVSLLSLSAEFIVAKIQKYQMIKKLEYVSYTDILTGLRNRNSFIELLDEYDKKSPNSLGIIFADINGMKLINDNYGHKYGDELIIQVSTFLKKFGGKNAYRIGGDEFVVFFENINDSDFKQLIDCMQKEFDEENFVDVSFGSIWKDGDIDVRALISEADKHMYTQKQNYYQSISVCEGGGGLKLASLKFSQRLQKR